MKFILFRGVVIFYVIVTFIMMAAMPIVGTLMFVVPVASYKIYKLGGIKGLKKIQWTLFKEETE